MARTLIGNEENSSIEIKSQVYSLTHDGAGKRRPYHDRVFISFSYGGKSIEDFGLLVASDGDRMNRTAYAQFEDNVENYETLDGQKYWGTHFTSNNLALTLVTDGMTLRQLDEFKSWFKPGQIRELILAEHPNRAIKARIAESPNYAFIPFEEKITMKVGGASYNVSTTLYKGEVSINFVMDEPHWYAKLNYMPNYVDKDKMVEVTINSDNENKVYTIQDEDMRKIMLEDGLPHQDVLNNENNITSNIFLGGNLLVTKKSLIAGSEGGSYFDPNTYAYTDNSNIGIYTTESSGLPVSNITSQYLFYSGTAKCYPKIKFSMYPGFDSNNIYITTPGNKLTNPMGYVYSNISIGDRVFEFTTPSILTGYNEAMKIFVSITAGNSVIEIRDRIKDEIKEKYSRAWAVKCLNDFEETKRAGQSSDTVITFDNATEIQNGVIVKMRNFISESQPMTFIFDSKTGEAIGTFNVATGWVKNGDGVITQYILEEIQENVGDMVRSDYLIIDERNYLNSEGEIDWNNCHEISSNISLSNVLIFYKNMYL